MWLFAVGLLLLSSGAVLSLLLSGAPRLSSWIGAAGAVAGSTLAFVVAGSVLWSGETISAGLPWMVPFGSLAIEIDPLTAVFMLPIALVVGLASIYGVPYMRTSYAPSAVGPSWFFFNLLAATMFLVVSARNGVLFLVSWEGMSLASCFLVLTDHEEETVRRAGWIYLVAMHLGTACLLVLFLLLGQTSGSLDFSQFACPPGLSGALFVLAVVGFGTKAGLMPLHVWLPEAHPAAPSHVSAVMSGVMIKTGIYGLLRTITFLPELQPWFGWMLIGIGVVSGIGGVLFALAQHDLKRLLAYSSVENIGIITMGLGVGLLGIAYRIPVMALLGITGALLHVLNHAFFKSLLFLGAGAVQHAAGTRNVNRLGGLLKKMPWTGAAFLVGVWAISGLPPLNGFVSELLIYLAVLMSLADSARADGVPWAQLSVLLVGSLALIGGLATACFTNAFGSVFLGEPRTDAAKGAHEAMPDMRMPMFALALACIAVAFCAPAVLPLLLPAVMAVIPQDLHADTMAIVSTSFQPVMAICVFSWGMTVVLGLVAWGRHWLLSRAHVDRGPTWDCGYAAPSARMQYTSSSFTSPLVTLFRMFLRPWISLQVPAGVFPARAGYASQTPDLFGERLFRPGFAAIAWIAMRLRRFQHGRIQLYVLYIALTILVLLIWKLQ